MEPELKSLLFGVIFLILIFDTTAIFSIVSERSPTDLGIPAVPVPDIPVIETPSASSEILPVTTSVTVSATPPAATPASTPVSTPVPTVTPETPATPAVPATPVPESIPLYVMTVVPTPVPVSTRVQLQPELPDHTDTGFVTIYSLNERNMDTTFPVVLFNLVNPPLLIDYTVSPTNITDVKYREYKQVATKYEEYINVTRPYEGSRFIITVRDSETGEIVMKDGFGKDTESYDLSRHMELLNCGNYTFEFDGGYGNVTLTLKVKKEGNL